MPAPAICTVAGIAMTTNPPSEHSMGRLDRAARATVRPAPLRSMISGARSGPRPGEVSSETLAVPTGTLTSNGSARAGPTVAS